MKTLIFLDTETTGIAAEDVLCQLAYKSGDTVFCELFNPGRPIPPEASAVTHITNKMVADKPAFKDSEQYRAIKELLEHPDSVLIAHNAPFDVGMLQKEGINPKQVICTLKVSRALDTDGKFSQYKLQYLRYKLEIDIEAAAHDALGDVLVLEKLFQRIWSKTIEKTGSEESALTELLDISSKPSFMHTINFGKHTGKKVTDIAATDRSYLEWLYNEKKKDPINEVDWLYTLEQVLK